MSEELTKEQKQQAIFDSDFGNPELTPSQQKVLDNAKNAFHAPLLKINPVKFFRLADYGFERLAIRASENYLWLNDPKFKSGSTPEIHRKIGEEVCRLLQKSELRSYSNNQERAKSHFIEFFSVFL